MNEKLKNLYQLKLENLLFTDMEKDQFSYPFLLKVPKEYISAKNKIMILGQETHGWCDKLSVFSLADIDNVMDKYEKTLEKRVLSRKRSKGKSCFIHRLVKINNNIKNLENTEIIWNNLLKFDHNGKSTKKHSHVIDLSIDILKEELIILKPDILLCQTGTGYDFILKQLFPDRENLEPFIPRKLWKFTADNKIMYRINHPCSRVKGGIKQYYHESIKDIQKELKNKG